MRKCSVFLLILAILWTCPGCCVITLDEGYELYHSFEEFSSVGLYNGDGEEASNCVLAQLQPSQYAAFQRDLEALPFEDQFLLIPGAVDPSFDFGEYVVRIDYKDGSYELISDCGFQILYSQEAEYGRSAHYSISDMAWYTFLSSYFPSVVFTN